VVDDACCRKRRDAQSCGCDLPRVGSSWLLLLLLPKIKTTSLVATVSSQFKIRD